MLSLVLPPAGANWEQVAEMTSHLAAMTSFEKASGGTSTSLPVGDRDSSATVGASGGTESTPAPTLPESGGGSDRSGRFASLQPEQAGLKSDEILLPHGQLAGMFPRSLLLVLTWLNLSTSTGC